MPLIDVFTCYTLAGAGSLFGLGLISLVRTEHPRVRRALWLYRLAFLCMAGFLWVGIQSPEARASAMYTMIGVAAIGASLMAWGFRQLNGQRTPVALGVGLTLGLGAILWWAGAFASEVTFAVLEAAVMSFIAAGTLLDQGRLMWRAQERRGGEVALLVVAGLFSLDWLLILWHTLHWVGPYPDHLLLAPDWLLPASAIGVGLLPLCVASVVFAIVLLAGAIQALFGLTRVGTLLKHTPHPVMGPDEIRARTQGVWDGFYSLSAVWERSSCVPNFKGRVAFMLISKLYRQMYANTGISTDSARHSRANRMARMLARPLVKLFSAPPMPQLGIPA